MKIGHHHGAPKLLCLVKSSDRICSRRGTSPMPNSASPDDKPKRFRIAFSFAGEKRDFIEKVARILADRFGEDKILYDKFHEAEFARRDLGIYLPENEKAM